MTTDDITRAAETAKGLRALADMIEANPETAEEFAYPLHYMNLPVGTKETVQRLVRAGARAGATVSKHQGDKYAGVYLEFPGGVRVNVYTDREQLCERVVTGTRDITREVPDPQALAAVPLVSVTETVETVEWRCVPLLSDESPAAELVEVAA